MNKKKIAVVTGGTRGIGLAIATGLADNGHRVIALARTAPPEPLTGVEAMVCDITKPDRVKTAFATIGPVDILINNAGISTSDAVGRTTVDDWNRNLAVNATGAFLCIREVIDQMQMRGWGRVVTVASTAAVEGARYTAAYSASKHAVLGLMRVLAAEVDGKGVTSNTVCPTFVRTPMTEATISNIAARTGSDLATAEQRLSSVTPHGRILEIHEVADAVLSLVASDEHGREVLLDGGEQP
ncbi:MAG: SDR family oxidoreductase [Actinobacteria bacterium]|nr:SDR family oxidoreductase [Actinomycetota bacterium]